MDMKNQTSFELCSTLLRQSAWRLQYKMRTQQRKEIFSLYDYQGHYDNFDSEIISKIYVKELLDTIPWEKSRNIIEKLFIEEKTEKEIALELKISQQAVSKWKIKGLNILRQNQKYLQS